MTRQVLEGQPIVQVIRSQVGGFVPDAPIEVDGDVYTDPNCETRHDELKANGAGEFLFYAPAGSVITVSSSDPIAVPNEPIQVVGVTGRPGGLAVVHPEDTPQVHETSAVSELVSDASLVGAPPPDHGISEEDGGAAAAVRVAEAQDIPPGPPADTATPDGTTATDPDAVAPVQDEQVTPQYEPVPDEGASHLEPENVTQVDPPSEQSGDATVRDEGDAAV